MSITPLPAPPSPLDTPEQFNAKAYAFFAALEVFAVEASALAASIDFTAADVNLLLQRPAPTIALASGTADALTATFLPAIAELSAGLALCVRASAANTSAAVTFTPAPGVIAPLPVVKGGGVALAAGDIAGAGHWLGLRYDALTGAWVLSNPAVRGGLVSFNGRADSAATLTEADIALVLTAATVRGVLSAADIAAVLGFVPAPDTGFVPAPDTAFVAVTNYSVAMGDSYTHWHRFTRANGGFVDILRS